MIFLSFFSLPTDGWNESNRWLFPHTRRRSSTPVANLFNTRVFTFLLFHSNSTAAGVLPAAIRDLFFFHTASAVNQWQIETAISLTNDFPRIEYKSRLKVKSNLETFLKWSVMPEWKWSKQDTSNVAEVAEESYHTPESAEVNNKFLSFYT